MYHNRFKTVISEGTKYQKHTFINMHVKRTHVKMSVVIKSSVIYISEKTTPMHQHVNAV